jgi:hypothetical protein
MSMTLPKAAAVMGISASYLRKLVADVRKTQSSRRYPEATHELYLSRHFVKDTKGRKNVKGGRFEWHIDDARVNRFRVERERRITGRSSRRDHTDMYRKLAELL